MKHILQMVYPKTKIQSTLNRRFHKSKNHLIIYSPTQIICCCSANEEELVENNLPNGCQKRARLMSIKSNGSSNEPNNNNNSKIDDGKSMDNRNDDNEMEEGEINEEDEGDEEKSTTKNEEPADEGIANLDLFELGRELKLEIADENEEDGEDWEKIGTAE
jgi:hypothetical protein